MDPTDCCGYKEKCSYYALVFGNGRALRTSDKTREFYSKFILSQGMSPNSFISTNLIHNSYINYIKLNDSTCFEGHPPILRRSMSLNVHVCSLWYSHSAKVNYCFIVLGIYYHFVKKGTAMCGCIALCCTITVA